MLLISQIFAVFRYSKIDFFFLDKNFVTVYFYHICVFLVLKLFYTTVFYLKKKKWNSLFFVLGTRYCLVILTMCRKQGFWNQAFGAKRSMKNGLHFVFLKALCSSVSRVASLLLFSSSRYIVEKQQKIHHDPLGWHWSIYFCLSAIIIGILRVLSLLF